MDLRSNSCHKNSAQSKQCGCGESSVWWMLLSHHPPCDMDRTWKIFGVNVCVRCLGMALFFLAALLASVFLRVDSVVAVIISTIAMIPAGIDFSLGELSRSYPRSNIKRFYTGALFGSGAGVCVSWCFTKGQWWPTLLFIGTALLMQLIIAFVFFAKGHLDGYLEKYEAAVNGIGVQHMEEDKPQT